MFTGIIETIGVVRAVEGSGSGRVLHIASPLAPELKPDQSLAHDGVCLTVESIQDEVHQVTAVAETLARTNFGSLQPGDQVNLERALPLNGRLDGHFVQGHVDTTISCTGMRDLGGSRELQFSYPAEYAPLLVEKGSVCLNGISLTVFALQADRFSVAIVPYTLQHTTIGLVKPGTRVHVEFDLLGKYISRAVGLGLPVGHVPRMS